MGFLQSISKYGLIPAVALGNLATKGLSAGYWYKISVQLDDGNVYFVTVGLK